MNNKGNGLALIPLGVFLVVYLGTSILAKDFYAVSVIVPFLAAALTALIMNRKEKFENKKILNISLGFWCVIRGSNPGHPD